MYRTALRSASRPVLSGVRTAGMRAAPRRLASTASPADRPRSWKGSALRWGLAVGAVYYYNSSPAFADEAMSKTVPAPSSFSETDLPTVDSVIEEKRRQINARLEQPLEKKQKMPEAETPQTEAQTTAVAEAPAEAGEDAGQQAAFNPETGEINWDCPCLGGMADGPCGEQFKTAFSCFVYSDEEPKGMDCIEKFQGMQECFREYPEIYGAELADEEAADGALEAAGEPLVAEASQAPPKESQHEPEQKLKEVKAIEDPIPAKWDDATAANTAPKESEAKAKESPIPAKWDDATAANKPQKESKSE